DHYLAFYFENRSTNIEIRDYVGVRPHPGSIGIHEADRHLVEIHVQTLFPLHSTQSENRWFYVGGGTVATYCGNGVMKKVGADVNVDETFSFNGFQYHKYWRGGSDNCREGRAI